MAKRLYASLSVWLLVWSVALPQSVENFRVVRVVGTVESSNLKRALRAEDIIPAGDQLRFRTRTDYIIVFHAQEGRKRIMGVPDNQPRELNILLQSFVKPDEKSTGTRGSDHAYIAKLQADLQDTVLILGNGTVELDPAHLSMKPTGSIKAQYRTKDKKSVIVTVTSGQSLHLDKKSLFPAMQLPTSRILLLYFSMESSSPLEAEEFLGNFTPIYVDDATLIPEIRSIIGSLKGKAADDIEKEIKEYLTQEYAKPISLQLTAWLKSNHLL
jgi:hypothetical protein